MAIEVVLERGSEDGGYLAWVVDLPGCSARAPSREQVLVKVPAEVERFASLLAQYDVEITVPDPEVMEVRVVGEVETPGTMADVDTDVLLEADRTPLEADDWTRLGSLSDAARAELLALLDDLDGDGLDHRPEGAPRSVREALLHVAMVEFFYAVWTFDLGDTRGVRDLLGWTRDAVRGRMAELAADGDERVTTARWAGAERPEEWTVRKAARRLIWHDLVHTRGLRRQLERG